MKIQNIFENIRKEEISEILGMCGYKKSFDIDENGFIWLKSDFHLDTNLHLYMHHKNITTLPLKIKKAKNFFVSYVLMSDYDFLPLVSTNINLRRIPIDYQVLDLKIVSTGSLIMNNIEICEVFKFDTYDSVFEVVEIVNCDDVYSIIFSRESIISDTLRISRSDNFTLSKNNFKMPSHIKNMFLTDTHGIKGFEADNPIKVSNILLLSSLYSLNSWRNIDTFTIGEKLIIENISQLNNFINVMMLNDCVITNDNRSIDFSKYENMKNRSESIMDCAVDLIDAGFEEAAEL